MRKILFILLVIGALVVGGAVVALLTIDVNQFRPLLVTQLQTATGRRVELASIRRSWKQGLGLELRGLVIHDDPAFGVEPMLAVEQVSARLQLAPLLRRRLQLATVTLDHPTIHVVKNAAGQLNIRTLTTQPAASSQQPASTSTMALPFLISSLKIRSATISFQDLAAAPPLSIEMRDMDVTASNIALVNGVPQAKLEVRNGSVKLSTMQRPVDSVMIDARMTATQLDVTKCSALIGNGTLEGSAAISDYRARPRIEAKLALRKILLQDVAPPAQAQAEQRLEGALSGDVAIQGTGATWPELRPTLAGQIGARVTEARMTNVNLLREAFNKLSMLPGVVERLEAKLPERHKQLLQQRDTAIRELQLKGRIEQGALILDPLLVATDVGVLNGQGRIELDGRVDVRAMIVLPKDLSSSITQSVKELSALDDDAGSITFPLTVSGQPPQIAVQPDTRYIAQRVVVTKGVELIEQLLNKGQEPEQPNGASMPPASESRSTEELLRDLIRGKR